jgi:hypothetical protein
MPFRGPSIKEPYREEEGLICGSADFETENTLFTSIYISKEVKWEWALPAKLVRPFKGDDIHEHRSACVRDICHMNSSIDTTSQILQERTRFSNKVYVHSLNYVHKWAMSLLFRSISYWTIVFNDSKFRCRIVGLERFYLLRCANFRKVVQKPFEFDSTEVRGNGQTAITLLSFPLVKMRICKKTVSIYSQSILGLCLLKKFLHSVWCSQVMPHFWKILLGL